jgi:uncharacterized protein (UPF0335 family)
LQAAADWVYGAAAMRVGGPVDFRSPAFHACYHPNKETNVSIGQNTAAGQQLTAYIERIERLTDEIEGLKDDLKDVKAEAKGNGFNVQALTKLIAIRRNKRRAEAESELLNDLMLYAHAIGMPLDLAFPVDDEPVPASGHTDASAPVD